MAYNTSGNTTHFFSEQKKNNSWEIRRRLSAKENGDVIGTISYTVPDEFRCADAIAAISEELTAEEYKELFGDVNSRAAENLNAVFVRISTEAAADIPALWEALEQLGCRVDPIDDTMLLWEYPVPNTAPLYLCLGLSVGMCIGMAIGAARGNIGTGMNLGMCAGMASGLGIGSMIVQSRKKKIEDLRKMRTESARKEKKDN